MEDTSILEVFDLNVSVESQFHLETLTCVSCHLQLLLHLQISFVSVNVESLLASQT